MATPKIKIRKRDSHTHTPHTPHTHTHTPHSRYTSTEESHRQEPNMRQNPKNGHPQASNVTYLSVP